MKKIIIVGTTGSGKTTFAKKLADILKYPHISLDQLFWKPNWQWSTDEELFQKVKQATNSDQWVLDGNYTRTRSITWTQADTVIWIDLPFWLTLYQSLTRTIKRAIARKELWPNTGNRESFLRMLSKDSILLWLLKTYKPTKIKYQSALSNPQYSHITFYRLRSRKEMKRFIHNLLIFQN